MNRRFFSLGGLLACSLPMAHAAADCTPRQYGVLSLVGDTLNVVYFQTNTGSHLDQNQRQALKMSDMSFDHVVLGAAQEALKAADPVGSVALFVGKPEAYAAQGDLFSGDRLIAPEWLGNTLQKEACSHLVLVTKHTAPAEFKTSDGRFGGNGSLTGLGFYVDQSTRSRRADNNEGGRGFIAPYVYVKLTLVEVSSAKVVNQKPIAAGRFIASAHNETGADPWGALSPQEKISILDEMIKTEIPKGVEALVRS